MKTREQLDAEVFATSILNNDTGLQVARILIGQMVFSDWVFNLTIAKLSEAKHVYQPATQAGWWSCGWRLPVDDGLALQIVSLNNSMFWDYWHDTIEPHFDTVLGTIYLLDSTLPVWSHEYLKQQMGTLKYVYGLMEMPYIFACTQHESPDAWSPDDIRIALKIPSEIPVVPCVATDQASVKSVLVALLEHVRDFNAADEDGSVT